MTEEMIRQFSTVVEFLGQTLGPDHEITLYDLEAEGQPVIAIANGRISGQTVGSALPKIVQDSLAQNGENTPACIAHFISHLQKDGKAIRSSAMLLRNGSGKAVGLLCINFDDSRFLELSASLLDLVHPRAFIRQQYAASDMVPLSKLEETAPGEPVHNNVSTMVQEIFSTAAGSLDVPVDRLNQEERIALIKCLRDLGIFRLKGAVPYVADQLGCSPPSVYRYLAKADRE